MFMKEIIGGIHTWSWFSEEKQIPFNGYYVRGEGETVIVDPPPYQDDDLAQMEKMGAPVAILITNVHHGRQSAKLARHFNIPIKVHEADAPSATVPVAATFKDGDVLECGLVAVHVPHAKSPGETAFHQSSSGALIVGDALIGKPPGQVRLLPPEKFTDPVKALQGVRRLLDVPFSALLLGDGESLIQGGHDAIRKYLEEAGAA
jgi:glyoxylase-like metal-dependent hydrolase (beta-lactamase superfamily II)